jgi:hypothetical protein
LAAEAYNFWMDPDLIDPERLKAFLKPHPSVSLCVHSACAAMGSREANTIGGSFISASSFCCAQPYHVCGKSHCTYAVPSAKTDADFAGNELG